GHATFAGYDFVNDPSLGFIWVDMLEHGGLRVLASSPSTTEVIQAAGVNSGYPMGAYALLASLRPLSFAPLASMYQPAIAAMAAAGAGALFAMGRRVGLPRPPAAGAAV